MTTRICGRQHYDKDNSQCNRVTSAGSSEELAESHVNETTWLATQDSEQPLGLGRSDPSTIPATHRLSHLRHRLQLINDNTGVCLSPAVTTQRSKEQSTSTVHLVVVYNIIHSIGCVTSATRSEELAESHVNKLLGCHHPPSILLET
jgi:hypothetical protein